MHEVAIIRLPFPDIFRQVPAEWRRYGRNVQALLYGLVLGMDLLTFIPYASFLVLLPLEALLGLKGGATLGAIYGLTRAALTLLGVLAAYRRRDAFSVAIRISRMTRVFHLLNDSCVPSIKWHRACHNGRSACGSGALRAIASTSSIVEMWSSSPLLQKVTRATIRVEMLPSRGAAM